MPTDAKTSSPVGWDSWEECRDYFSLEALFLGQNYDRKKSGLWKRRYMEAVKKATYANSRCREPYPEEPDDA